MLSHALDLVRCGLTVNTLTWRKVNGVYGLNPSRAGYYENAIRNPGYAERVFRGDDFHGLLLPMGTWWHDGGGWTVAIDIDAPDRGGGFDSAERLFRGAGFWREGDDLESVIGRFGTASARSAGGGYHVLFTLPESHRPSNSDALLRAAGFTGIDVKGRRGHIKVAPTRKGGGVYRWLSHPRDGISPCPESIAAFIGRVGEAGRTTADKSNRAGRDRKPSHEAPRSSLSCRATGCADGPATPSDDPAVADIERRFPIPHEGTRDNATLRAIGHLMGKRTEPAEVRRIVREVTRRAVADGRCRSDETTAFAKIEAIVATTERNIRDGKFIQSNGLGSHRGRRKAMVVSDGIRRILESVIFQRIELNVESDPKPHHPHPVIGDDKNDKRLMGRIPSGDEFPFVEAIAIAFIDKLTTGEWTEGGDKNLILPHEDIRQIAGDRHGVEWDDRQLARLLAKYTSRHWVKRGCIASVHELLCGVSRGTDGRDGKQPAMTEWWPTGILELLDKRMQTQGGNAYP